MLLRIPAIDTLKQSAPPAERGDDWYNREYAQTRLHGAKTVQRAIESGVSSSAYDPLGQTQITYQREEIGRLEQDLVAADAVQAILERYRRIESLVRSRANAQPEGNDADTLDFLVGQIGILEREGAKPRPNRAVLSAADATLQSLEASLGIAPDTTSSAS